MTATYTGPSGAEMLANHTLAQEVIARHNDLEPVLDSEELDLLEQFVNDPSQAGAILKSREPEIGAQKQDSLVAHVISLHGTDRAALRDEDIKTLKAWFANGRGKG